MSAPISSCPGAPDWLLPFVTQPPPWSMVPAPLPDPRISVLQSLHRHRFEILAHYPRTPLYPSSWGATHPPGEVGPTLLLWALSPWFSGNCPKCLGSIVGLAAGGRGHHGAVRGRCLQCEAEVWRRSEIDLRLYCGRLLKGFENAVRGGIPLCHSVPWTPHPDVLRLTERLDGRCQALADLVGRLDATQQQSAAAVRQAELASPELNTLLLRLSASRGRSDHA